MNRRRSGFVLVLGVLLVALAVPMAHTRPTDRRPAGCRPDRSPTAGRGLPDMDVTVGRPTRRRQ